MRAAQQKLQLRSYVQPLMRALLCFATAVILACGASSSPAQTMAGKHVAGNRAILKTRDIQIEISSSAQAPSLLTIAEPDSATWSNTVADKLPKLIEMDGRQVAVVWSQKFDQNQIQADRAVFVYESREPHLRLEWEWRARAKFGPVEHRILIHNLSEHSIWLPLVDSLHLALLIKPSQILHNFYVEKGADTPSSQGTHWDKVGNDYRWTGRSSTYAHPEFGEAREIIPVTFLSRSGFRSRGLYAGIEFSGRTHIVVHRHNNMLDARLGLNDELGAFRTRLNPGDVFETPTVFLGAFHGDMDTAGNQLRLWVRTVLNNPPTLHDEKYPLTVSNSWGSGMQADESLALKMIADARELGLEMFHLDAGWFRSVGDWRPDPVKFPHGLSYIADQAHQAGLRFGLWVDWSQAGVSTSQGALNVHQPRVHDWLVNDVSVDWKPEEFKGQTIDLGVPEAQTYAAQELHRITKDYRLDMLEHDGYLVAQGCTRTDHPHAPPNHSSIVITRDSGFDFVRSTNSTDVSYHAVRAYYSLYEQLRRDFPGLLLEICNDGGRMIDFGSAAHGDYFSITDTYDPLSNRRAFYDTSFTLPPAMLESYIERWPVSNIDNFLYMLRSGMMGWMSLMQDTTQWNPEEKSAALHAIALYKEELRPLIRKADLYHVSPRPDGVRWDGVQYWDRSTGRGVLFAFRGSTKEEASHAFLLKGLSSGRSYRIHFEDGSRPDRTETGMRLMSRGLVINRSKPLSSELAFIEER